MPVSVFDCTQSVTFYVATRGVTDVAGSLFQPMQGSQLSLRHLSARNLFGQR
jgi:hypothetical protein